jgi:uncharacterized phiE125 gp8 family phage protein
MTTEGLSIFSTVVDGALEPVTLDELKLHLAIDTDDHNALLDSLLQGARREVEKYTGLSLIKRNVKVRWEKLTTAELPYGPVSSITSVKDKDGELRTDYEQQGLFGDFVSIQADTETPIVIEYIAGYDIEIDAGLRLAILKKAAEDFTYRPLTGPGAWKPEAARFSRKSIW